MLMIMKIMILLIKMVTIKIKLATLMMLMIKNMTNTMNFSRLITY